MVLSCIVLYCMVCVLVWYMMLHGMVCEIVSYCVCHGVWYVMKCSIVYAGASIPQ